MLIATFRIGLDALALAEAFEAVPGMIVEAERIAAHSTEWTMPCLWVRADDFDAVDEALAADPSVTTVVETDEFDDEKYYHVDWDAAVEARVNEYIDKEGSILEAKATDRGWEVRFRFVDREQMDTFCERLNGAGHSYELVELFTPGAPRQTEGGVTPAQREALVAAAERGYFRVPRDASAREVADDLDMTQQSLSELLRRGTENIVSSVLITDRDRTTS